MTTWRLQLLGRAKLTHSGLSDAELPRGLSSLLIVRIVLAGSLGCSREALAEALWPGENPIAGRHRLRTALLALRQFLERAGAGEILQTSRTTLTLVSDRCTSDVAEFLSALRTRDWARADALYLGDLLPGSDDALIERERERLSLAHRNALHALAETAERCGDLLSAIAAAERLVSLEPQEESGILLLIRLLVLEGHIDAAHRRYRKLRRDFQSLHGAPLPEKTRRQIRQYLTHIIQTAPVPVVDAPIRPASLPPSSLPLTLTRFFGREEEIGRLRDLLERDDCRLVTITGPGGAGKTRLAIEVAATRDTGALFVGLADIGDANLISDKILGALRLARDPNLTPLEQVIRALREQEKPPLLLLDNAEHLLTQEALCDTIRALLAEVPQLRILATSRQPLEIEGEQEFFVAPLPTPPSDADALNREAASASKPYASVALFVDRMQAVRSDFRVTARNAPAIADLCRRLDGLPLALEIAATWARTLTPTEMVARLGQAEQRNAFLVSRRPRATDAARHASLQNAIDWSYRQLSPELQRFFARLHVFRGGCTAEAAAEVCEELEALDYLAALQERSLVIGVESGTDDGMRYRLLETLREYGREQLNEAERADLVRRHSDYYARLAERAEPEMLRPEQQIWGERLRVETDNFRAAFDAALADGGNPGLGLRLAGALWRFWVLFVHLGEARQYLTRLLALAPSNEAIPGRTKALFALGNVAFYQGDSVEGIALAEECLHVPHLPEDAWIVAFNQSWLGVMQFFAGRFPEANAAIARGLTLSRAVGDDWLVGYTLAHSGLQAFFRCDFAAVLPYCEESLTYAARVGEKWLTALSSLIIGLYHQYERNDADRATELCLQGIAGFQDLNDVWCAAFARSLFAFARERQGRTGEAEAMHRDGLAAFLAMADKQGAANSLEGLGEAAYTHERWERAATLWGAADALHEQIGLPMWPFLRSYRESAITATRAALGEASFNDAWQHGRAFSLEEAATYTTTEN